MIKAFKSIFFVFVFSSILFAQPRITSISPDRGPAGTIITITGTGFSEIPAENIVAIGDNTPIIKGSSLTELKVVISSSIAPVVAGTFPVVVTVGGLSSTPPNPDFIVFPNLVSYIPDIGDLQTVDVKTGDIDGDGSDEAVILAKGNCCRGHVIIMKLYDDEGSSSARPMVASFSYGEDEDCDGLDIFDSDGDGTIDYLGVTIDRPGVERKLYLFGGLDVSTGSSLKLKGTHTFNGGPGNLVLQRLTPDDSLDLIYSTPAAEGLPASLHFVKNFDKEGEAITSSLIVGDEECDDLDFHDMDSDGDLDIIAATGAGIHIFHNNVSDFQFLRSQLVDETHPYSGVAVGDLDGDGHPDLVALRSDSGIANVFFGDPLDPGRVVPTTREAGSGMATGRRQYKPLLLADVDGDGHTDIVCASGQPNQTASILLIGGVLPGGAILSTRLNMDDCDDRDSDGDGTIDEKIFAIGNFDIDDDCDFAFTSCRSTAIGPPLISSFSPDISPAGAVVTIEGENFEEASSVHIGEFEAPFVRESPTRLRVTVPDAARSFAVPHVFDGIRVSCPSGVCTAVKPFTVSPTLVHAPPQIGELHIESVQSADLDGDGKDEMVMLAKGNCCRGHVIIMKLYDDEGSASSRAMVSTFFYGEDEDCDDLAVADLDGDGMMDVCVSLTSLSKGTTSFAILLGDSSSPELLRKRPGKVKYANITLKRGLLTGDVNGDGFFDIVYVGIGENEDTIYTMLNNPASPGDFSTVLACATGQHIKEAKLTARLGTSFFDIFCVTDSTVDVYRHSGGGSVVLATRGKVKSIRDMGNGIVVERRLGVGDLDGDGALDAVVFDGDSGRVTVCLDEGDGSFRIVSPGDPPSGLPTGKRTHLVVSDFDGDGRPDIAIDEPGVHFAPGKTSRITSELIYENDEWTLLYNRTEPYDTTVVFEEKKMTVTDRDSDDNEVCIGDLDGDGLQDLVVTSSSSGVIRPPVIESISSTRPVGGDILFCGGRNFQSVSAVDVCNPCNPPQSFEALSDSQLSLVLPADFGEKFLAVSNPEGTARLADPVTVIAAPDLFVTVTLDSLIATDSKGRFIKPAKRKKGLRPNWSNLLEEVVGQGGFQPGATESDSAGGLRVGISHIQMVGPGKWKPIKDSAAIRAWLTVRGWDWKKKIGKNWSKIQKTLKNKDFMHDGIGRGFDSAGNPGALKRKMLKGELKVLDPKKTSNRLFAELVVLKVNIAASQLGKTPPGFGELVFENNSSMFDEMTVHDIARAADSSMTYWKSSNPLYEQGGHSGTNPLYEDLYETINSINNAFAGPLDTASFEVGSLVLEGVVDLDTIPILKYPAGPFVARRMMPTNDGSEDYITEEEDYDADDVEDFTTPVSVRLHKNYPNPFNPLTTISFDLRSPSIVTLKVFNVIGQEIATLADLEEMAEGYYNREFDAGMLSSGIYFYRLDLQERNENDELGERRSLIDKMLLLK